MKKKATAIYIPVYHARSPTFAEYNYLFKFCYKEIFYLEPRKTHVEEAQTKHTRIGTQVVAVVQNH